MCQTGEESIFLGYFNELHPHIATPQYIPTRADHATQSICDVIMTTMVEMETQYIPTAGDHALIIKTVMKNNGGKTVKFEN